MGYVFGVCSGGKIHRTIKIIKIRPFGLKGVFQQVCNEPCPWGYYNHPEKDCVCGPGVVKRYGRCAVKTPGLASLASIVNTMQAGKSPVYTWWENTNCGGGFR